MKIKTGKTEIEFTEFVDGKQIRKRVSGNIEYTEKDNTYTFKIVAPPIFTDMTDKIEILLPNYYFE